MALSGVRSSWLMLARNSDLARLACSSWALSAPARLRRRAAARRGARALAHVVELLAERAELVAVAARRCAAEVVRRPPRSASRCASRTGRMNDHEMTKPHSHASSDGDTASAAVGDHRIAIRRGNVCPAGASCRSCSPWTRLATRRGDLAVEGLLMREQVGSDIADVAVANRVGRCRRRPTSRHPARCAPAPPACAARAPRRRRASTRAR